MNSHKKALFLLLALAVLVAVLIAAVTVARAAEDDGAVDDNDDGVVDVAEAPDDSDIDDQRRTKRFGGDSYKDFGEFARKQQNKRSSSSDDDDESSSSSRGKRSKDRKKPAKDSKDDDSSSKKQSDSGKKNKKDDDGGSDSKKPKTDRKAGGRSRPSSSSSSFSPPPPSTAKMTVTERVALLNKGLADVKGDLTGTSSRLLRLSSITTAEQESDNNNIGYSLHFNTTLNKPTNLKLMAKLVSTLGIDYVVDSDALESANARLSQLRMEHYTVNQKVEDALRQLKKEGKEGAATAAAGDLPKKDIKVQELKQGVALASSMIDAVLEIEEKQRAVHKRLLRAGKAVLPSLMRYVDKVATLVEEKAHEIRGIRSGDIDGAAPASHEARDERRKFTAFAKRIKAAQGVFVDFARQLDGQLRRGRGITKALEPLFVAANILVRFGAHPDVLELLVAADFIENNNNHGNRNGGEEDPLTAFAALLSGGEAPALAGASRHAAALADGPIAALFPATPTGVIFGLETSELIGMLLVIVVPFVVVQLSYRIVESRVAASYESAIDKLLFPTRKRGLSKNFPASRGQRLGGGGGGTSSSSSDSSASATASTTPSRNPLYVTFVLVAQILFLLVPLDMPLLSERVEDIPIVPNRNGEVTLPSVLFAAMRLQVSNGAQYRLLGLILGILVFQAYTLAGLFASTGAMLAAYRKKLALSRGDGEDDDDDEQQQENEADDAGAAARKKNIGKK